MRNVYVTLALLLFSLPALAATLNVNTSSLATAYSNSNTSIAVLNFTLNATGTNPNVSITLNAINISISGISTNNFSYVEIRNSTNNALLGSNNTFNVTDNMTTIRFSPALVVNSSANLSLIVFVSAKTTATRFTTYGVNVTASSFEANYSAYVEGNGSSVFSQIQDVHANASITPRFVDTSVTNQSFFYVIRPTGTDRINKTVLNIPVGYTLASLDSVEHDGTNSTTGVTNLTSPNQINVTFSTSTTDLIILRFKLNTNSSDKLNLAFNSTLENGNLTNVATDVSGTNTTVSTQQIVNVTSVTPIKNAAYLNGTDYWEFLFSLNFTVNVSGRLQFNMSSWNSSSISIINLNSSGTHYATIRSSSNFSNPSTINITNEHNMSSGIAFNTSSISNSSIYLRMVIPSSVTTVSSSWWAVYTIIFRSDP